ncbi:MAG: DMT family transporter [Rhodoferax sp.]|nr:DMT family transporter [Rhodoferax sp.]
MRFFKRLSPKTVGLASALITVVIWTAFIVIARASADPSRQPSLNPFDIALARILGASLILLPWGWWLVRKQRLKGSLLGLSPLPLRETVTVGLFGGLLYAPLAYSGFGFAPAAHASVLMPGSLPLWTALLAVVVLHDRLTRARVMGLALIVAGDLLVGGSSLLHALGGGEVWKGDLLFMTAAFCWSIYSVLVRRHALDAVRATIAITAFAFVAYVPSYLLLLFLHAVPGRFLTAPLGDIVFQMVFQGVGSVVISGITFTKMIGHYGPVRSTMITALVPGLSALAAVMFLGEPLHWNLLAGLALVTGGIVFGVRRATAAPLPAVITPGSSVNTP